VDRSELQTTKDDGEIYVYCSTSSSEPKRTYARLVIKKPKSRDDETRKNSALINRLRFPVNLTDTAEDVAIARQVRTENKTATFDRNARKM